MAELLAALALATDIGTGRPLGHGARTCLNATAIGVQMGFDSEQLRTLFQVSLLRFLGCTADSHETAAAVGGDDLGFNGAMGPVFFGGVTEMARAMATSVGTGESFSRRGRLLAGALTDTKSVRAGLAAHCEVAAMLASRLGMSEGVVDALRHVYERWDGKGFPLGLRGEEIAIEARICAVAGDADLLWSHGIDPKEILRKRTGKGYDAEVVEAWRAADLPPADTDWEVLLASEPDPVGYIEDFDSALTIMADFADLKSPWTRGHSRAVSGLAATAADIAGHIPADIQQLKRAGLVHDLGRVGVENGIWDKPGALTTFEREKVKIHSYVTGTILALCPALQGLEPLAAAHHERMDGSGYHRQWAGEQLSEATRILAAADVMAALRSARPHRPALEPEEALSILGDEVESGRLDADAVACVVSAAGGEFTRPAPMNPDGLTDREVEVLSHIASGMTNRDVADALFISPKTVGRHVENIYVKIGVSTRAGAAVYAMDQGLLR